MGIWVVAGGDDLFCGGVVFAPSCVLIQLWMKCLCVGG